MGNGKRRTRRRKASMAAMKKILKPKKQKGGLGPAAGVALGMALPMLLNSGTSIVGSIFGKKTAQRQTPSVNQQPRQPPPQWMTDRPRRRRRPRRRYYDDYDGY